MKRILLITFLSAATPAAFAQRSIQVSLGGGINNTTSTLKDKNFLGNGAAVQADVFIPFLSKNNSRVELGVIAGGGFITSRNLMPDIASQQALYKLHSGSLNITNTRSGKSGATGCIGFAGLQANFSMGPVTLSPSFSGGYFALKQGGFTQQAVLELNDGSKQTISLWDMAEEKQTGFVMIPRLKVSHRITRSFSVYASAAYNTGGEVNSVQRRLKPQGGFKEDNTYEPGQLISGKPVDQSEATHYRAVTFTAGVSLLVNGKTKRPRGKVTKPGGNGLAVSDSTKNPLYNEGGHSAVNPLAGMAKPGNPIGGIIVKGGKNPGGNLLVVTSNDNGRIELKGLEAGDYLFTITAPDSPQGEMARPGNPIGGIIVKGGKNPGGNLITVAGNGNGQVEFKGLEAGDYAFTLTAPDAPQGKTSEMARPGNPIGGIIVKGGKNPGGNLMVVTSNDKGEFEFKGLAAGEYQFTLTAPQEKSSGQGVKRGASEMARPGNPIGGIIVKGGKNPGGGMTNLGVTGDGVIRFEVLEAGDYKFQIQAPGNSSQPRTEYERSGLKDVLKTNV
ncbi:carboxypeptidase regulatory-like domain-containing protein [Chitinophaga deserti]|uniref:carboxypeptidase regulatory-like domain-containing protein n=1 Tax=Chitinophaga deserti TaxID=2164099 RepID=UPI000D6C80C9|nr:carboxypeptidase regulatory-like domain-containing protein [Chitinophaga deserti]